MKKYVAIWHEINDSGVPTNVMGMSEPFDSWNDAKSWIDGAIAEDQHRLTEDGGGILDVDPSAGDGVWRTIGNGQTTYYHIAEYEVPGDDKVRYRLKEATDTINEIEKYANKRSPFRGTDASALACVMNAVERYKNPLKEFEVQVVFSPATVMKVMARTAKEAQNIVNSQVDNGTLVLSDRQKLGIMNDILENIESVKTLNVEGEP